MSGLLLASGRRYGARLCVRLRIRERQCTDKEGAGQSVHVIELREGEAILSKVVNVCSKEAGQLGGMANRSPTSDRSNGLRMPGYCLEYSYLAVTLR